MDQFFTSFGSSLDIFGFVLFILVFPVYHALYPLLARTLTDQVKRARFDAFRESWIEGLIERRDLIAAAQQTRNLTMVNSVLVSSSLILMGLTANFLVQLPELGPQIPHPEAWAAHPEALRSKLYLLIIAFALAFSFFMTSLRHLGHFVLVIGTDPKLVNQFEGSPVKYFSGLINRASHRYTLGVRCFYSAFPLFAWLFDSWVFILLTLFWGVKFIGFQDFSHIIRKK